jgi:hypothetical protein
MNKKHKKYQCAFETNPYFDFKYTFINAIEKYINIHGYGVNKSCGWSNKQIFAMLDEMDLYNKDTLFITDNKFYFAIDDKHDYENLYRCGWATNCGHTIPTEFALDSLTSYLKGKKTLSVGSGLGLWEYMLENNGCDIICTDIEILPFTYKHIEEIPIGYSTNIFKYLIDKQIINSSNDIDILFLGWPEPDTDCNCCPGNYCKTGYDMDTLLDFKGSMVILIADNNENEHNLYTVCSLNCRDYLKQNYNLINLIQLPFTDYEQNFTYKPKISIYLRYKYLI